VVTREFYIRSERLLTCLRYVNTIVDMSSMSNEKREYRSERLRIADFSLPSSFSLSAPIIANGSLQRGSHCLRCVLKSGVRGQPRAIMILRNHEPCDRGTCQRQG
jgi:hypothetical protein